MPPGRLGRQPNHFCPQFESLFDRFRVNATDNFVHDNAAEHGEIGLVPIPFLYILSSNCRTIDREPKMTLDDDGPRPNTDGRVSKLQI